MKWVHYSALIGKNHKIWIRFLALSSCVCSAINFMTWGVNLINGINGNSYNRHLVIKKEFFFFFYKGHDSCHMINRLPRELFY